MPVFTDSAVESVKRA